MSNINSALMAGLAVWLILIANFVCGYAQLIRPIVVGTVVGLFLGDVATGAIVGASLEVVFLGIISVGGSQATDPFMATAIATAFTIIFGVEKEAAITLAIPIGYIGLLLMNVEYMFNTFIMSQVVKLLDHDREKAYCSSLLAIQYATQLMYAAVVFVAVAVGGDVITSLISNLPEFVVNGITAVGAMLPAIGLGMLINLMWSSKMCIYLFVGFAVMIYMQVPILFLAIMAVFVAYLVVTLKQDRKGGLNTEDKTEEEAFFS